MNVQKVVLDVDKRYDPSQVVTIGQGDQSGTTIMAEVYDNGLSVALAGYTAMFEVRLPDGVNYVRDANCTIEGNTISYVVDEEHCAAVAGHTDECYFDILSGNTVVYSTSRFRMNILRSAHADAQPAESWDSAIDIFIDNAQGQVDGVIAETNRKQGLNDAAQVANNNAQAANDAAQDRNDLDQLMNNDAAAHGYMRYLESGEYDPTTGVPTISAENEYRMCVSPNPDPLDTTNLMLEWARRYDSTSEAWTWELVGGTGWRPTPATTAQADDMWDDDINVQSNNMPDVSWMTYYRNKIRSWVTDHFIGKNTAASVLSLTSSGEVTATETSGGTSILHRLTQKLDVSRYRGRQTWGDLRGRDTWGSLTGEDVIPSGTSTSTANLSLTKPGYDDTVDVATFNADLDTIDTAIGSDRARILTLENSAHYEYYTGRDLKTVLGVSTDAELWSLLKSKAQRQDASLVRVGDYFDVTPTSSTVNKGQSMRARLAGIGHNYQFGDTACPWAFWFVIDSPIDMTGSSYAANTSYIYWNTTADNNGNSAQPAPYLASNLHAWELGEFLPALPTALQNVLANHRIMFEQRYSASSKLSDSTGWGWGDAGKVFSLSETEVYGQCVWGTKGYSVGCDAQLPLFRDSRYRLIGYIAHWWLRSVSAGSPSYVCYVHGRGDADSYSANSAWVRPRPCFLIG